MTDSTLSGKRVLLIVLTNQFRDEEVFAPKKALEEAGAEVTVGASTARTCYGMNGGSIEAEVSFAELSPAPYDAVVIAGGSSAPHLFWKDKALLSLVTAASEAGKVIGASSLSTVVLAKAGRLAGKQATVYFLPEAIDELRAAGATYVTEDVVVDGRVITAEGPAAVEAFSGAIARALTGTQTTATTAQPAN